MWRVIKRAPSVIIFRREVQPAPPKRSFRRRQPPPTTTSTSITNPDQTLIPHLIFIISSHSRLPYTHSLPPRHLALHHLPSDYHKPHRNQHIYTMAANSKYTPVPSRDSLDDHPGSSYTQPPPSYQQEGLLGASRTENDNIPDDFKVCERTLHGLSSDAASIRLTVNSSAEASQRLLWIFACSLSARFMPSCKSSLFTPTHE